ncbi:GGDEF domain-containing protein [Melaminivora jejuensis]|uniref:GGDEF domain-containing protein n=1 Tax=Melaminivora jejuensis TaxID=1267217 RepID=UPI002D7F33C9|nr:GGDEF domain-containing protein [Melaminivora jejuensis]
MASLLVAMLCVHLLCFGAMFWLISTRLQESRLGMDVFALGNAMLGLAYVLQLSGGPPGWNAASVLNHTLTLCTPVVYWIGGLRFFGRPARLLGPLLMLALAYALAQALVQWLLGSAARYAMLALASALIFAAMVVALLHAARTSARDLRVEMLFFAVLLAGLGALNAAKFVRLLQGGLAVLDMGQPFQRVFYAYMTFLTAVLAPAMIWLVLRRLTDALRATAAHDPLTQLLNRRGLLAALEGHFGARSAGPAHLLLLDIDHFKHINDTHGHQVGDLVLCQVAQVLREAVRHGDLVARMGGEEFVVISLDTDEAGALQLAERLRAAIESQALQPAGAQELLHCSVTIGVARPFHEPRGLGSAMQEADAALYRGKAGGRNRVEPACPGGAEATALHPA